MRDILHDIISAKRGVVSAAKCRVPLEVLKESVGSAPRVDFRGALLKSPFGIIAEFKRKSPSKGWIHPDICVADVAPKYLSGGASAMSVLTDGEFFGGTLADLIEAKKSAVLPVLRKDFIIDEYQVYEAAAAGADAVLLIAAALSTSECGRLAELAGTLGMQSLLEIHSSSELCYVSDAVSMVGVNNRNLGSFVTDVNNSFSLAPLLPSDKVLVSESGISSPDTVIRLRECGFRGFLIGENFMKAPDPGVALADFIERLK